MDNTNSTNQTNRGVLPDEIVNMSCDHESNNPKPGTFDCAASKYGELILPVMNFFWENEMFCDIILVVNSTEFRCHRIILASVSTYFRRLLCSDNPHLIRITNIRKEVLAEILRYAYTGKIKLTHRNVFEILLACHFLEITSLIELCAECASIFIDFSNCFEVVSFAKALSVNTLYTKALDYIYQHQDKLFSASTICENDLETVLEYFADRTNQMIRKGLPITSKRRETYFFLFLLTYISSHPERVGDFPELLRQVNLPILPALKWRTIIGAQEHLLDNALVQYLLELSDLFRQGQQNEDIPPFWNPVSEKRWNISSEKPIQRTEQARKLCPKISSFSDNISVEPDVAISSIELYFRPWALNEKETCLVLGGFKMKYCNELEVCHGMAAKANSENRTFLVSLLDEDLITGVDVAYGWMINRLTFHTITGKTFGPFGDSPTGREVKFKAPAEGQYAHLHCFSGSEVLTYNEIAICDLRIFWARFD